MEPPRFGEKPTKREIREWLRRVREDARDLEAALKADDGVAFLTAAEDLSGSAGEVWALGGRRYPDADAAW